MPKKHFQSGFTRIRSLSLRLLLLCTFSIMVIGLSCRKESEAKAPVSCEPGEELAASWWSPQRNVWTPVGWKDHLFRFNVLYNGTVIAQPHLEVNRRTAQWKGFDLQLTVTPSPNGEIPAKIRKESYQLASLPDQGVGIQGWTGNPTPVLWTEWPLDSGLVLREEIFAHLEGAKDVRSGIEPLYAWIRLSVAHVDELKAPPSCSFLVHLGRVNLHKTMEQEDNLTVYPDRSAYPRKLTAESYSEKGQTGLRVREEGKKIRLAAIPSERNTFAFFEKEISPGTKDYYLKVTLPARKGVYADLLLPMLPGEKEEMEKEMALGQEGALKECDSYWSSVPATAAHIETPEKRLNEAIAQSVKFAGIIAEKNPATGEYSFLSGSWHYENLWPTPTSMTSHMLLDNLGYHQAVEKHLEIFKKNQGTVVPPGQSYSLHPGYFSSPKTLTSIDWLADHGAILYQVSRHALLTGDKGFISGWQEAIIRACEFIRDSRAIKGHGGVEGILPPAVATDRRVPAQSVWSDGWNYKGLTEAVKLLRRINHPRAGEFTQEADDYKEAFARALRAVTDTMPQWTDREGKKHRLVPYSLSAGGDLFHAFYLDAGPLFLVFSGLMEAEDTLMKSTLMFFREGPNTSVYDPRGNCWQRPVLIHEMSSCEPCYSWNVYHSWQLGDRYHYLEGLYSLLNGALASGTYISCETRHGIYGNIFASPLLTDLVRLSVVDDRIADRELHLLRLVPLSWLKTDFETRFENMPTEFGPVTVRFKLGDEGKALELTYQPSFREKPTKVVVHVPPMTGLAKVIINGREAEIGPQGRIVLE